MCFWCFQKRISNESDFEISKMSVAQNFVRLREFIMIGSSKARWSSCNIRWRLWLIVRSRTYKICIIRSETLDSLDYIPTSFVEKSVKQRPSNDKYLYWSCWILYSRTYVDRFINNSVANFCVHVTWTPFKFRRHFWLMERREIFVRLFFCPASNVFKFTRLQNRFASESFSKKVGTLTIKFSRKNRNIQMGSSSNV